MEKSIREQLKLCYIDDNTAYFTTKPLSEVWGDDWNDAPYEHNAGEPYTKEGDHIVKMGFYSRLQTPAEIAPPNSPYSVEQINKKEVAWLSKDDISIWAGESVDSFLKKIKLANGIVYLPDELLEPVTSSTMNTYIVIQMVLGDQEKTEDRHNVNVRQNMTNIVRRVIAYSEEEAIGKFVMQTIDINRLAVKKMEIECYDINELKTLK